MRTHLRINVEWETTAESGQQFTIGFVVADMDFIAPTPRVSTGERGRDWALLDGLLPGSGMNTYTFGAAATPVEGFTVDLRSKRKVQELNQTWCLAGTYTGGATGIAFSYWTRTLLALP